MDANTTPRTDAILVSMGAAGNNSKFSTHARELERELNRARKVIEAAKDLCAAKGRYHTEIAMKRLIDECEPYR